MQVGVIIDNDENEALEKYAGARKLHKRDAAKRIIRAGLIRSGNIKPNQIDKEMGLTE